MSGGGGKGGGSTQKTEIPQWQEDAIRQNIGYAQQLAGMGYAPYYGPSVAAMTPFQMAGMQNISDAASAFGMNAPQATQAQATDFGGGMMGYSSGGLLDQAIGALKQNRPEIYDAYAQISGAPGVAPNNPYLNGSQRQQQFQPGQTQHDPLAGIFGRSGFYQQRSW